MYCLALHYPLRTTGSIRLGSLLFTFPTRVLTGQQVISSARWSMSKAFKPAFPGRAGILRYRDRAIAA
jgi:hypothetical protein